VPRISDKQYACSSKRVAYDPAFYLAYCQLARTHEYLYFWGADHTPARVAQARQALEKALSLAPEGGEAHLAAAAIAYHCERDYKTALEELAIARCSLPNDPSIFEFASFIARRQGRWEQCIENAERAQSLIPGTTRCCRCFFHYLAFCAATPMRRVCWIGRSPFRRAAHLHESREH